MEKEEKLNYEQDLAIDPHSLDEDLLKQPGLYMKYSALVADMQSHRDQVKERLEVVKAELDKAIRSNPTKYGLEKIVESAVAATIILQLEYRQASEELIQTGYELNMLQSAVRALDHKRAALENVVKLWLGSYFSGPKEPRDIPAGRRIVDIARDKISSRMRKEMNKSISEEPGLRQQEDHSPRRKRG